MIDTIWLILHHSTVNYKIDFMAEVGAKINVDIKRSNEYRIVGSLQNMQIYIEPTFVLIQGSLPKYYYGSNLVSLPRTELSNAIDKLSTDLGLPLREAIITRIDIGMNVEVDNPCPQTGVTTIITSGEYQQAVHCWISSPNVRVYTDKSGWNHYLSNFDVKGFRKEPFLPEEPQLLLGVDEILDFIFISICVGTILKMII